MATQRLNDLMNHSGTPQLRRITVSLRVQREGGGAEGGVGGTQGAKNTAGSVQVVSRTQVAERLQM